MVFPLFKQAVTVGFAGPPHYEQYPHKRSDYCERRSPVFDPVQRLPQPTSQPGRSSLRRFISPAEATAAATLVGHGSGTYNWQGSMVAPPGQSCGIVV